MDKVTKEILKTTKDIDFGCDFIDGICEGARQRVANGFKDIGNPCCGSCYHNVGYLHIKEKDLPEKYKSYFSYPKGFLGEKGCRLPREMRARRCIIYACRDAKVSDNNREILLNLERTTKWA